MKVYEVGGSVRDALLGLPHQDHDYVVVGATPEQLVAQGYRPVGADFPVFLHPATHAEYALARTERKTAPGYQGFVFHTSTDVTLEEDLARRDFTINAIAQDADGTLIDPYHGAADLKARLLRHVSNAFVEDPVRVLRGARFVARFAALGFKIAPETKALMQTIAVSGELDHLVPERVWQEVARGLMESTPSAMFGALRDCGALVRIMPEVDGLFGVPQSAKAHPEIDTGLHVMMVIDYAAKQGHPLAVRFAALVHDLGKGTTPDKYLPRPPGHEESGVQLVKALCERLRVPGGCRDLGVLAARWHGEVHRADTLSAEELLALFDGADAMRRPERFRELVATCACDHHGRLGYENVPYPPHEHLLATLVTLQNIDQAAVAKATTNPAGIPSAIHEAKLAALKLIINEKRKSK
ncbi:MAG: multifunctional CCA addition/repair protein [Usitatibacteraceae bacterium]